MSGYAKDVLVETGWLEEHLHDDSIRIVEVDENPALYAEEHVPGAIGLDWGKDLQDQLRRDFLDPQALGELLGARGISDDHLVVLHGDRHNWFAAYAYWLLKYHGHGKLRLVNGPREKWISEGRPTTTALPNHLPTSFVAGRGDERIRARRGELLRAPGSETKLVDARSPAEFSGELIAPVGYEQQGAQRAGHISGAVSVPWAGAVREDGTFKSSRELRELYGDAGLLDRRPIIIYCRTGERAAHSWFVLHELLRHPRVKHYDGSWIEWGNLVDVPIARGG